jgi:glycerol-3-phosphate dehydrogenase
MACVIERNPSRASSEQFDLVVVGGGFYGAMLALEAARRSLRPLLIERSDFGHATSWNSLRIVHGGLRYLQTLDLKRYFESVGERKWFLEHFPGLVKPLVCILPLYGQGVYRRPVFSAALVINELLSRSRNKGVDPRSALPQGRIIGPSETEELFPAVDRRGLQGAALWFDAVMPDSQRVLMEILRWAVHAGASLLNYMEVEEIIKDGQGVAGVAARDAKTNGRFEFRAPLVINCAGPWVRELAARFDRDVPRLFYPSVAFNLLLDREPDFTAASAVRPSIPGGRTYFLHPWKGKILAGTFHAPRRGGMEAGPPSQQLVDEFVRHLRAAIPGFDVTSKEVLRVHWGLLPATAEGTVNLAIREVCLNHAANGGPSGLYSVSGVKLTTARLVAEKVLRTIFAERGRAFPSAAFGHPPAASEPPSAEKFERLLEVDSATAYGIVRRLVEEEAVLHLEDLLLRRTDWGSDPRLGARIGHKLEWLFDRNATSRG